MSTTETTDADGGVGHRSPIAVTAADGSDENDMLNAARQVIDDLYATRDNFTVNRVEKTIALKGLMDSALQLLDSVPIENQNSTYGYLRGKVLNCYANYKREAEDYLAKAVKENPSLGDAWLCLGNCIAKKGDNILARKLMRMALLKGPTNKRTLCQLSSLEKKMAQDKDSKFAIELIKVSIDHANEAIAMDIADGYSWYCLGNALLVSFFLNGARNLVELEQSLNAFRKAQTDAKMKYCPDLVFNSALVNKYLENYEQALSGFEAAASIDPALNANLEIQKMIDLFDIIEILLRFYIHCKEFFTGGSSLDAVTLDPAYERATIDILKEGEKKAFAIVGKVTLSIKNENNPTMCRYYILCDSNYQCYILTVYGARADAIKEGDQVTILDPCYRHQNFTWKEKRYVFESLRVDDLPKQVRVDGQAPSPEQTA